MQFSKMHGLGNDFMIVNAVTQKIRLSFEIIRHLADRNLGVGFDQLLVVEPPYDPETDFHYRVFNSDGREATQCGNGARCFATFVYMKNLTRKREICISTATGRMILTLIKNNVVQVNMGEPNFDPKKIPFLVSEYKKVYSIRVANQTVLCSIVSIGNPHCVIIVDNVENAPVLTFGPLIAHHTCFPEQSNVGFMEILHPEHIRLRVYERGVGETQSCGSGACAAVAVGVLLGKLAERVKVDCYGGQLIISWCGPGYPIYLIGPATHIYDGSIYL